jgi:hypothetical protein
MFRDGWLRHVELVDKVVDRALSVSKPLQHRAASRVGKRLEDEVESVG